MPRPFRPKANKRLLGIDTWHEKRCDFSYCGHINHAITISSSLDTNLDFSLPPLQPSLHSMSQLSLSSSSSLPLSPANSADAPCHSSYFSLLKFPNWSQLEPQRGGGWRGVDKRRWGERVYVHVCVRHTERKREREPEREIKINEPVLRVVILVTGLQLTTDC